MHGEDHGVEVGGHVAALPAHPLGEDGDGMAGGEDGIGPGELPADEHGEQSADDEEEEAHEQELDADDFVVGGEDVAFEEWDLVMMSVSVRVIVNGADWMWDCGH